MSIDDLLSAYRLGEQTLSGKNAAEADSDVNERIKYWIYEFEMSEKARRKFEAICTLCELTEDEFFEAAVLYAIRRAEAAPESFRRECLEAIDSAEYEIRLIRHYPVYIGETEAQAYKRKLAEEAAKKET